MWESGREVTRDEITQILQAHFRPEYLNRIDEIVIFHPLKQEHLSGLLDIQLWRVIQQKIQYRLSDALLAGEFAEGGTVQVDINEDHEITFHKAQGRDEPEMAPEATV